MPARIQFTTQDEGEIQYIATMGTDQPWPRDDRWWITRSVRVSRNGMTVWATESGPPACSKMQCGKPATKVVTVSDGVHSQPFYRCDACADGDVRLIPRVQPGLTVTVAALRGEATS